VAGCYAFSAKCTVYVVDFFSACLDVDVIRTFLFAKSAVVTCAAVLHNVEKLELRLCVEDLEEVAYEAECTEKHRPRDICSHYSRNIICSEKNTDPDPELE
jgi:hypothetical protein